MMDATDYQVAVFMAEQWAAQADLQRKQLADPPAHRRKMIRFCQDCAYSQAMRAMQLWAEIKSDPELASYDDALVYIGEQINRTLQIPSDRFPLWHWNDAVNTDKYLRSYIHISLGDKKP
jgi:hypothetical protein